MEAELINSTSPSEPGYESGCEYLVSAGIKTSDKINVTDQFCIVHSCEHGANHMNVRQAADQCYPRMCEGTDSRLGKWWAPEYSNVYKLNSK